MKIAFDHQIFTYQSYGGISRYFVRLVEGLLEAGEDVRILAPIHRNRYLKEFPSEHHQGVYLDRFPPKTSRLVLAFNRQVASVWARSYQPDVLHETYYAPNSLRGDYRVRVLTVYDMVPEKFSSEFPINDTSRRFKRRAVARADHIICISHSTKRDLCQILDVPEEKVSVVHLGFECFDRPLPAVLQGRNERPYLLYVGSRGGYKNFSSMLKAVASRTALQKTFDIVVFGGGMFSANEKRLISTLGYRIGSVRQIGGDDRVLGTLYSGATAFVYPSMYEGFGLPPLEAMAHDCPVVSSNTSSMPEVVGPAGQYFDPGDIDAQADAISAVVFDEQSRHDLIQEGRRRLAHFSWSRCAAETREIYREVLRSKSA